MPIPIPTHHPIAATDAERLADQLLDEGGIVYMLVPPSGCPHLAFQFRMLPPAPRTYEIAALIRSRFANEPQFKRDLFGWLYVEGDVYQRYAEHQPRIKLDAEAVTA